MRGLKWSINSTRIVVLDLLGTVLTTISGVL
eukprot:COSAG05_NODE_224_length_13609_cov_26.220429_10_plen_31_part_00